MTTWRLTLHKRTFTSQHNSATMVAELGGARSRRLERELNKPAQLTFAMEGRAQATALVVELMHDVIAWRDGLPYFRGVVAQSQDSISEQAHTVTFTCHSYDSMLARRYLTRPRSYTVVSQDTVVSALLMEATISAQTSSGVSLAPGSWLPLVVMPVTPEGNNRGQGAGVPPRDRQYPAQSSIGQLIEQLAAVENGFDFDVLPLANGAVDGLRIFYPQQGVPRDDVVLEYGAGGAGAVASLSRSVNSADYANYVRTLGKAVDSGNDPMAPQLYGELANDDANDVGRIPIGLWEAAENDSDVSLQTTLDEHAAGYLNRAGVLVPSYSVQLRAGAYEHGAFNMGDSVPLVVNSGRLHIGGGTTVRIVGMSFDIGDDGQEDVGLTLGRPPTSLVDLMRGTAADVDALARR